MKSFGTHWIINEFTFKEEGVCLRFVSSSLSLHILKAFVKHLFVMRWFSTTANGLSYDGLQGHELTAGNMRNNYFRIASPTLQQLVIELYRTRCASYGACRLIETTE